MNEKEQIEYTAKLIDLWSKDLEGDDYNFMLEIIDDNAEKCRLTPEEFWEKLEVGQRYNVGFQAIIDIVDVDREARTYSYTSNTDDGPQPITSTLAGIEIAYDLQVSKSAYRNFPILL